MIVAAGMLFQHAMLFLVGVIVARTVGAADYGQFSILRSITTALISATPLGLNLALLKHSALHDARKIELDDVYRDLRIIVFAVNAALPALCLAGAGNYIATHVYRFDGFALNLVIALASMPFLADLAVMGAFYRAKEKPAAFALLTTYLQPSLLLFMAAIAVISGPSVRLFVFTFTAASIASSILVLLDYRRRFLRQPSGPIRLFAQWNEISAILRESLWMALNLLTYTAMRSVDILVLGLYAPAREVGAYGVLSAISALVQTYPFAMSQTLGPRIARFHGAGDFAGIRAALDTSIARSVIVGGFVFGGIAGFGPYLDLVFGSSFAFSRLLALLLPLGWLISAVLAPTSYALSMTNAHRTDLAILAAGTAVLVISCFLSVPTYGSIAAAGSVVAAFTAINLTRFVYVSRLLGFVPGKPRDVLAPLVGLALGCILSLMMDASGVRTLAALFLACAVYTICYAAIALRLLITEAERAIVAGWLRRLWR